jgi:hypothetical protein
VRASDIKAYLASGNQATEAMRQVRFTFYDRLVLTPVEFVSAARKSLLVFGALFIINLFVARPFGLTDFVAFMGAVIAGTVITPVLLPFIPGKAFAWKGWLMGLFWAIAICQLNGWYSVGTWMLAVGYILALPSVTAYLAMNFTGSSTYTSFSGVTKEMSRAIPLILVSIVLGAVMVLINSLIG